MLGIVQRGSKVRIMRSSLGASVGGLPVVPLIVGVVALVGVGYYIKRKR